MDNVGIKSWRGLKMNQSRIIAIRMCLDLALHMLWKYHIRTPWAVETSYYIDNAKHMLSQMEAEQVEVNFIKWEQA